MKNRLIAIIVSFLLLCGAMGGPALSTAAADILGDADRNGKVNTTDARCVLQYAAGIIGSTELNLAVADVDANGNVNTTDARRILQYAANLISTFRPTYSLFPNVPDFGALYGVPEYDRTYEDGHLLVAYAYSDILRADEDGQIMADYATLLLNNYGFIPDRINDSNGNNYYWMKSDDGTLSMVLAFSDSFYTVGIFPW